MVYGSECSAYPVPPSPIMRLALGRSVVKSLMVATPSKGLYRGSYRGIF